MMFSVVFRNIAKHKMLFLIIIIPLKVYGTPESVLLQATAAEKEKIK